MNLNLEGKTIIVTGGTRNLGRAISLAFLNEGANVVAAYCQDSSAARELEKSVLPEQRNKLRTYKADVSSADACHRLCNVTQQEYGELDVLVNNAAVNRSSDPDSISDSDFDVIFRNTLRSTLYMTRAAFAIMKKVGGGRIVNISSAGVHTGNPEELLYLCAKAGVEASTRAFARLGSSYGITVNAIAPHVIAAGMGLETVSHNPSIVDRIPLKRLGNVDELVSLVLFLASERCEYLTGQVVHLNGGRLMK